MAGTLYLVATPIGNLDDITYRAIRVLGEVDVVACEDTRHTRKLLEHFSIRKPLVSYHEHNETAVAGKLIRRLEEGADIALVSDAGTPLVSDPGYRLVRQALENGIGVVPVPGPSAVVTALSAAGLPSDSFHFAGFLPAKASQRRKALEKLRDLNTTVVVYEAPHRILDTLDDLRDLFGDRPIVAAREMTKLHEEFLHGTAASVREALTDRAKVKGEFTVLIGKPVEGNSSDAAPEAIRNAVERLLAQGMPRMEALKTVARELGLPKRTVYRAMEERPSG